MAPDKPARCTHLESCALFPLFALHASLAIWQTYYCESDFEKCARYHRSLEGRLVPPNLLPNGKSLEVGTVLDGGTAE